MFLYFLKSELLLLLITIFFLITFIGKSASLIVSIDSLTRVDINLLDFNSIYFLWTNINYIYIYFIPFILLAAQVVFAEFSSQNSILINVVVLFLTILLSQLTNNFSINVCLDNITSNANLLLFNAINKYHPLLLYIAALGLISLSLVMYQPLSIIKLKASIFNFPSLITFILVIILSTMYAGSWWAYQEGSWGGWWAWDSSETFGLIIMISAIMLYHFKFLKSKGETLKSFQLLMTIILVGTYLFLQLNFGITSHNFGLKDANDSLITNAYIAFMFFMIVFIRILLSGAARISSLVYYAIHSKNKINYYLLITALPIFLSILPLATDLLWKKFEMNAINFAVNYYLLSGLTLVIFMQWFGSFLATKFIIYTMLGFIFANSYLLALQLILFVVINKLNNFSKVHLTLLVYVLVSWLSNNYFFNHWIDNSNLDNLLRTNIEVLNYPLIGNNTLGSLFNSTYSTISNNSNALNSGTFFLESSNSEYTQLFRADNNRVSLMSETYDNLTFSLPLLFLLLLKYLLNSLSAKYIIKC